MHSLTAKPRLTDEKVRKALCAYGARTVVVVSELDNLGTGSALYDGCSRLP